MWLIWCMSFRKNSRDEDKVHSGIVSEVCSGNTRLFSVNYWHPFSRSGVCSPTRVLSMLGSGRRAGLVILFSDASLVVSMITPIIVFIPSAFVSFLRIRNPMQLSAHTTARTYKDLWHVGVFINAMCGRANSVLFMWQMMRYTIIST